MKAHLDAAVRHYRLGEISAGGDAMVKFIDKFQVVVSNLATDPNDQKILGSVLEAILAAQQRGDYNYAADLLEYQIGPLFNA